LDTISPECEKYGFKKIGKKIDNSDVRIFNEVNYALRNLNLLPQELDLKSKSLNKIYNELTKIIKNIPIKNEFVNGILKIDTTLTKPFEWNTQVEAKPSRVKIIDFPTNPSLAL